MLNLALGFLGGLIVGIIMRELISWVEQYTPSDWRIKVGGAIQRFGDDILQRGLDEQLGKGGDDDDDK